MQFNLLMPMRAVKHYDRWIGDGHLSDVALLAEEAGFEGVAMTDHPFPDDAWLAEGGHHSFDPFVALSFMAAATDRVRLLTFVLVAGYRNPYVTAKALASLDKLSGGRVIAGMAAGYLSAEFEVLGAEWEGRGPRFDAAIDAMRAAWTGETVDVSGDFAARGHTQLPRPGQANGPPIWIGGNSKRARRRAAEHGDGWIPLGQPAAMAKITRTPPLETVDHLATLVADVQQDRAAAGRPPLEICFAPFGDRSEPAAWAEKVRRDLGAYEDAGVTWLTLEPHARTLADLRQAVSILADQVIGS
jgi:probable F420-dependent oxidoreductase